MNQVSGQFAQHNDPKWTWFTQFSNPLHQASETFSIRLGVSILQVLGKHQMRSTENRKLKTTVANTSKSHWETKHG